MNKPSLMRLLTDRYEIIKRRLTARVGSSDLAEEALQDTWLRLAETNSVATIANPEGYIYGVAVNAARDRKRKSASRLLSASDVDSLLDVADEAPDPAKIAEAKSELRQLVAIIDELPPRQRAILLAARLDATPRAEIARQMGISLRLVERELQRAQEFCLAKRLRTKK